MTNCPHTDGMVAVNSGDILNLFRYLPAEERPLFYRLANWPQLFCRCCLCNEAYIAPDHYELLTWAEALAWAEEQVDG